MTRFLAYIALVLALSLTASTTPAFAQPTIDGAFVTLINPGAGTGGLDQLQVEIQLTASEAFNLGNATLMFTFNEAALALPSGPAVNQALDPATDYAFVAPYLGDAGAGQFYLSSSVTVFGASNRLSVNLVLDLPGFGQALPTTGAMVVRLFFDITNAAQTADLSWIVGNDANPTVVFQDDNQTEVALGTFLDEDTLLPVEAVNLQVYVAESSDPVVVGSGAGNLTYTVEVTNGGPSDATGVVLESVLILPSGVTLDAVTPSAGTFAAPMWLLGNLASGASATLTVVVTVDTTAASGTDVIANTTRVTALNETDTNAANDAATEATSIVQRTPGTPEVDLEITMTESSDPVTAGSGAGNLAYLVTVTNEATQDATGLALNHGLTLPAGVTLDSIAPSTGTFTDSTWTVGDLAVDQSETLTVVLTVEAAATEGPDVITARTWVTALDQANRGDDAVVGTTSIAREADLALTKDDGGLVGEPSQTIPYTLTYHNHGPSNAEATLVETVPEGASFDAAGSTGAWSCPDASPAGTTCTLSLGALAPGDSASQTFAVAVDSPLGAGLSTITNTALITAAASDTAAANNIATATTPVVASVVLRAVLTDTLAVDHDNDGQADSGDVIAYTATVSNAGDREVADVVYHQTVDAHTAFDCSALVVMGGSVTTCTDGSAGSFSARLTTAAGGASLFVGQSTATLTFEVVVSESVEESITEVSTQGVLEFTDMTGLETLVTDDPATVATADATVTVVYLSPGVATSVDETGGVPTEFALSSNYPNPFNPQTTIPYAVPEAAHVRIVVYDLLGRVVAVLVDDRLSAGRHEVVWQADDLPSGMYLVRLEATGVVETRRMTLVK